MTDYITEQEYLDYAKSGADPGNQVIIDAIAAASRQVEGFCGRPFDQTSLTLYYTPGMYASFVDIDDLATATGLSVHVDTSRDSTYATALTLGTDYVLEPRNQQFGGIAGWPFMQLRGLRVLVFPYRYYPWQVDTVKVTGTFGWPAVPAPVKQATKIIVAQLIKLAEAPLGVAGWGAFGDIRVRDIPQAATLLGPYMKGDSFGIA